MLDGFPDLDFCFSGNLKALTNAGRLKLAGVLSSLPFALERFEDVGGDPLKLEALQLFEKVCRTAPRALDCVFVFFTKETPSRGTRHPPGGGEAERTWREA